MKIETELNIGDKAWIRDTRGKPIEVTIGQVRAKVTDSPGRDGEEVFDNYKPQKGYEERYMAVETGIGTGNVWELGNTMWKTREECEAPTEPYDRRIPAHDSAIF